MTDIDLLHAALEDYFSTNDGIEYLEDIAWNHTYSQPDIVVDDLQYDEVTGLATFELVKTGTELNEYEYGDIGHHGEEVESDGPGEITYHFKYKFDPKNPRVINVDKLECVNSEISATVGDLR